MIGFVVVPVESSFADCKGRLDCERVFDVDGTCGKVFVDVIHGRYDSGDAGRPSGKEQRGVLEDLTVW